MRKTILSLLALCALVGTVKADETLQIVPQRIVAGSQAGEYENCFSIEMVNDDNVYTAIQFDLYLPEGVEIDDYGIELNPDRFPNKVVKKQIVFDHTVLFAKREEGFYRVSIYGESSNPSINGTSGPICDVYYTSGDELPAGVLPVRIEGIVLAVSGTQGVSPSANVSFLYTEGTDFNGMTSLDMSGEGCVTTRDVASATRSLMTNPNSLLYLNEGSEAEGLENVVVGETCERLVLADGMAFNAPKPFTAVNALYTRTLETDGWYSLCLPFAATGFGGFAEEPVVECFERVDADNGVVYFKKGNVEADKPCIFKAEAGTVELSAANAEIAATKEPLVDGDMEDGFFGAYSFLPVGSIGVCYSLAADGSSFGVVEETACVEPFCAVVMSLANVSSLTLTHDGGATSVKGMSAVEDVARNAALYNLAGQRVAYNYKGIVIKDGKKRQRR